MKHVSFLVAVSFVSAILAFSWRHIPIFAIGAPKMVQATLLCQKVQRTSYFTMSPKSTFHGVLGKATAGNIQGNTLSNPNDFCLYVPIFMYHHIQSFTDAKAKGQGSLTVDTGVFDQQMAYLISHGYTTISLDQLINALRTHTRLPGKSVALTFDDGYQDVFTNAYPIFQKYHIVANLMISTGLLGVNGGNNVYMSWDQLKQMANSGSIFVYDHTFSHHALGTGSRDKNQTEIMLAKQQLEQNLGKPVAILAYPYGSGATIPWVTQLLQQDGFIGAVSSIPGTYQCASYIMSLRRMHIGSVSLIAYGF